MSSADLVLGVSNQIFYNGSRCQNSEDKNANLKQFNEYTPTIVCMWLLELCDAHVCRELRTLSNVEMSRQKCFAHSRLLGSRCKSELHTLGC